MKDICENRHKENDESAAAFEGIRETSKHKLRREIAAFIQKNGPFGATAEEISKCLEIRYTTVSARCSELKRDGVITKNGTRKTESGASAAVLVFNHLQE